MEEVPSHDYSGAGHDISGLAPFLWRLENMSGTFKKVDYDQALYLTVRLGDCLPLTILLALL